MGCEFGLRNHTGEPTQSFNSKRPGEKSNFSPSVEEEGIYLGHAKFTLQMAI